MTRETQPLDYLIGKTGRCYSARSGMVSVYVLSDAAIYWHTNLSYTNVLFADPVPRWRTPTALECATYVYFTVQMTRDEEDLAIYPKVACWEVDVKKPQ